MILRETIRVEIEFDDKLLYLYKCYKKIMIEELIILKRNIGEKINIKTVHSLLYRKMREKYPHLYSEYICCSYRQVYEMYKSFCNSSYFNASFPKIKNISIRLHKRLYKLNKEEMTVVIKNTGKYKILNYTPNLFDNSLILKEATLFFSYDEKLRAFIHISAVREVNIQSSINQLNEIRPIGVDINRDAVFFGMSSTEYQKVNTSFKKALNIRYDVKNLRKRYGSRIFKNKKLYNRYFRSYKRMSNILKEFANNCAKEIIDYALKNKCNVIILENLKHMRNNICRRGKTSNTLYNEFAIINYRKIQLQIERKALKNHIHVVYINPFFTSQLCPKCSSQMKELEHRYLFCSSCFYQNHRDVIAIENLIKRFYEEHEHNNTNK